MRKSFGYCSQCCYKVAAEEAKSCLSSSITLELEAVCLIANISQSALQAWCQYCLKKLSAKEKQLNKELCLPLVCRRNRWRGTCEECIKASMNEENA